MSDENQNASAGGQSGASPADAVAFAGASQAKADAYLDEQTRFVKLQSANLLEQNEFEVSHLRFRRLSDYARVALEVAAGLVVLLIVCGLGTMVWSASRDDDLVVDAFSVPPDIAQTGLTGSVLANRVLDRFGDMDHHVHSFTSDFSAYHGTRNEEARVEIPDTGISIGELNRYLRAWLGHETHVTGELVRAGGNYSLTVRYGDVPGTTVEGPATDLDKLIQKTAENMFLAAKPLRLADYLSSHGRIAEAREIAERETHEGTAQNKSLAYVSLAQAAYWAGDERGIEATAPGALRLDPANPIAWYLLTVGPNNNDHSEELWRVLSASLPHVSAASRAADATLRVRDLPASFESQILSLKGDNKAAIEACKTISGDGNFGCDNKSLSSGYAAIYDFAKARALLSDLPPTRDNGKPDIDLLNIETQNAVQAGDWRQALTWSKKSEDAAPKDPQAGGVENVIFLRPFEAEALALSGDIARARAVIATTPPDCDICAGARGRIETAARNWNEAARWFAIVSVRSPDIPAADTDWGAMLTAKGDLAGAVAKFESAHRKGPHFADPLEMWGEILIRQNHSDLALAKFEEADKYAPNWGRLHLKWGEALLWSGDKAGARKQFAVAAALDLAPSEKSELARMRNAHV